MKNSTVLFRVDGNSVIGHGHLMRCIALSQMIKDYFSITFVSIHIPDEIRIQIIELGFRVNFVSTEIQFLLQLTGKEIVIVDHYGVNTAYQKKIKSKGCKLVCIDDIYDKEFYADLIINHAPMVEKERYKAQPYTDFALGLDYAMLRPFFLKNVVKEKNVKIINQVLICFGGSDVKNLTFRALEIVQTFNFNKIVIVLGQSNMNLVPNEIINDDKRIVVFRAVDEETIANLIIQSDLVIVPCSTILIEAITLGALIIAGMYVDNQKYLYTNLKKLDAFESANTFERESIITAINNVLSKLPITPNYIIDGLSGKRIAQKIIKLNTRIRPVIEDDCLMIYQWANNEQVRVNSVSRKKILWDDHKDWFRSTLSKKNTSFFVLEYLNKPVGQIRFDFRKGYYEIDYSIDSKFRGMGFGKLLIRSTLKLFKGQKIRAIVKKANFSSQKIFVSFDFKQTSDVLIKGEIYTIFEISV